jgi:hypothetical protein
MGKRHLTIIFEMAAANTLAKPVAFDINFHTV